MYWPRIRRHSSSSAQRGDPAESHVCTRICPAREPSTLEYLLDGNERGEPGAGNIAGYAREFAEWR